jgi:hypothetical protein
MRLQAKYALMQPINTLVENIATRSHKTSVTAKVKLSSGSYCCKCCNATDTIDSNSFKWFSYILSDITGLGVQTYNSARTATYQQLILQTHNNWTAAGSTIQIRTTDIDAHWGPEKTYDTGTKHGKTATTMQVQKSKFHYNNCSRISNNNNAFGTVQ